MKSAVGRAGSSYRVFISPRDGRQRRSSQNNAVERPHPADVSGKPRRSLDAADLPSAGIYHEVRIILAGVRGRGRCRWRRMDRELRRDDSIHTRGTRRPLCYAAGSFGRFFHCVFGKKVIPRPKKSSKRARPVGTVLRGERLLMGHANISAPHRRLRKRAPRDAGIGMRR